MLEEIVPDEYFTCDINDCNRVKTGKDLTILTWGSTVNSLSGILNSLEKKGISCELIDLSCVYPIKYNVILEVIQ
jgi:pyruvate/2-oxoglutarate/acetoin dehydrogenase E1 component